MISVRNASVPCTTSTPMIICRKAIQKTSRMCSAVLAHMIARKACVKVFAPVKPKLRMCSMICISNRL